MTPLQVDGVEVGAEQTAAIKHSRRRKRRVTISMQSLVAKLPGARQGLPCQPTQLDVRHGPRGLQRGLPSKRPMTKQQHEREARLRSAWQVYDVRQRSRDRLAGRLGTAVDRYGPASAPQLLNRYQWAVFDVYSNRLVAPELIDTTANRNEVKGRKKYPSSKKPSAAEVLTPAPALPSAKADDEDGTAGLSKVAKFIWQPRAKWADSKNIYDTDQVELKRFNVDWQQAVELGVAKLIDKRDDDGFVDDDGDGISNEVEETKAVMWDYHDRIIQLFEYYAAAGGGLASISLNQWSEFVEDFELTDASSKFCKKSDMDTLFIAVNAKSVVLDKAKAKAQGGKVQKVFGETHAKALSRVEFLYVLVEVAINKFVMTGAIPDVSAALHALLIDGIEPLVDIKIFTDYNDFRKLLYEAPVNDALYKHESSLRMLFGVASGLGVNKDKLMQLEEWQNMLKALGFMGPDISDREVRMCFVTSRMAVIDARTKRGFEKESSLPFEGFLEAICRLSVVKALPTDEELRRTGCPDAGMFMLMLENKQFDDDLMDEFEDFKSTHAVEWGEEPLQPLDRCVEHTVTCMIRSLEEESRGDDDLQITFREALHWAETKLGMRA